MADVSFSGDATVVDGTAVASGTGSADLIGGVYNDSLAALSTGNGGFARLTTNRALHANLRDAGGHEVLITSETTGYALSVGGGTAHDAVDAGNPVKIGGYAKTAAPTAVSNDGDRVNAWFDRQGAQIVQLAASGTLIGAVAETTQVGLSVSGATAHDAADAGAPLKIGGYASQGAPTAISADGDRVNAWLDRYGRQLIAQKAPTANLTNVASSASSVTVLAANTARLGATVQNDSTAVLYLKFGATASTSSYTVQLASKAYYEVPFGYLGIIDGIWASANGNARVTELV